MSHAVDRTTHRTTDAGPGRAGDPQDRDQQRDPRRWWTLGALGLAQLMVVLDATIVNIALPSAQQELGFSDAGRQWVITAYSIAFGGLLLFGGRLSDLAGRRRVLVIGLVGFAAASALGGASTSLGMLIVARAVQGAFGAFLAPSALSLLTVTFSDPAERGKAFGIFGSIAGGGAAIGLLLGGVLTEYLDWSWCLYVNVGIAAVAGAGALAFIPKVAPNRDVHLDIPGVVTVSLGLAGLVYAFGRAETNGWSSPTTIGLIAGSVALLGVFVLIQRRARSPLLPLHIVLDRWRGGAYLAMALTAIGMFAVFLFLTYYLQQVQDFTPLRAGFAFLPMVGGIVVSSTAVVPWALPRIGPRLLIAPGQLLSAAGLVYLWRLDAGSGYATHVVPALVVSGLGLGLIFATAFNIATAGTNESDAGVASAMVNTCQQVGGALGTALLNSIATAVTASYLASSRPTPATQVQAAVAGETRAFLIAAGIFAVAAVVSLFLIPAGRAPQGSQAPG